MLSIDGKKFREMLACGAKALEINRSSIDELNVFPVPDGDTGTNMYLTISSAMREVGMVVSDNLSEIALAFSKGALKGARGNSGVITSQIFKGFAVALDNKNEMTAKDFTAALKKGTEIAYSAVTKPKEGTILTVVRVMAENSGRYSRLKSTEIEEYLEKVLVAGNQILQKTPEMLPVLAKAGVVDAGGKGLITKFEGFKAYLLGEDLPIIVNENTPSNAVNSSDKQEFVSLDNDYENITYYYCTEFLITHLKKSATTTDIDKYRDYLTSIGDCVLVIGDLDIIKTHVHTNHPDQALKAALKLGELDNLKIENMMEQHRKIMGEQEAQSKKSLKKFAMVSICAGEGLKNIFKDLMVDEVIEGGQTMNPSVYDILNAVNRAKAENVFVLPNNSNIILAAEQAKELADVNVFVIPTTCVPEGISAALVYSEEASPEENFENMKSAFAGVKSAEVTHAVRNTRMNGFSVKVGDIIGIADKKIIAKNDSVIDATVSVANKIANDADMLTLYYGEDVNEDDAMFVVQKIQQFHPDLEIAAYQGGQPHYYYLLSAE